MKNPPVTADWNKASLTLCRYSLPKGKRYPQPW